MIENNFHQIQIERLKKGGILNDRIKERIYAIKNPRRLGSLVKRYFNYYEKLWDIKMRYKKIQGKFDFSAQLKIIDHLNKKSFTKFYNMLTAAEKEYSSNNQQEHKGSVRTTSGGLPSLGKRR